MKLTRINVANVVAGLRHAGLSAQADRLAITAGSGDAAVAREFVVVRKPRGAQHRDAQIVSRHAQPAEALDAAEALATAAPGHDFLVGVAVASDVDPGGAVRLRDGTYLTELEWEYASGRAN